MMLVKREADPDEARDEPVPTEAADCLQSLRLGRNLTGRRLPREICDEAAHPYPLLTYGRQGHAVIAAYDALCDAVGELSEEKRQAAPAQFRPPAAFDGIPRTEAVP